MIRSTLSVRVKDTEEIIQLARKHNAFPMELTIFINDPKIVVKLKTKRKFEVAKIE
jgi:acyl-CoA reductase-like NAD-dependent aldehyde dehydrogenase